ncbi:Uncharacterised protein (plasmid) [Tsukamurella tyrosinosolvens]|uniref:STAS domain-containing protein n=1 Tax=Tsukamurella tyrosinosolvens TaxID=57704 RepID=A0A1H4V0S3_TSUTY|nr:hypothetical protein [Tsukamurella tyrosinosolvens]KXO91095.1 hypothetical protein AXK58_21945 [Tsukamurella tyrosinosolvens]SEC74081.1 hypothetical protein SAMN04489793_3089 [Tsukamurella tyrosinosolvens]VEH90783.1 Uncharacterised protein [Tsukamurella tyrosinosolvens]
MTRATHPFTLTLPALAGSRHRVQRMLDDVPADLSGTAVRLDCSGLIAATRSFTDELVVELLVRRNAESVRIGALANAEFREFAAEAGAAHDRQERVVLDAR